MDDGQAEVIGSPIELVPLNALVVIDGPTPEIVRNSEATAGNGPFAIIGDFRARGDCIYQTLPANAKRPKNLVFLLDKEQ